MTIVELRNKLGLSQAQFGNLFGVHPMTVSKWERNILQPTEYQRALMTDFEKAAKKKEVMGKIGAAILGAGIVAALYLLLKNSRD